MRRTVFLGLLLLAALAPLFASGAWSQAAGAVTVTFDDVPVGQVPPGWQKQDSILSGPVDRTSDWKVVEHEGGRVLQGVGPSSAANDSGFLLYPASPDSFDLSVKIKLVGTTLPDEHVWSGLVFRFQDEYSFYGGQMDWEKDNPVAEIKFILNGTDMQIFEKKMSLPFGYPTPWHTLRVRFDGVNGEFWMDGQSIWKGQNSMFPSPGKVGLFVSNGATVLFDDFKLQTLPGGAGPMASRPAEGWSVETVAKGGSYAPQTSIGVGADGPHVAYFDQAAPAYSVSSRGESGWSAEVVDDGTWAGAPFSKTELPPLPVLDLQVDGKGQPHMVYIWEPEDATTARYAGYVAYATKDQFGTWIVEPVEVPKTRAWYPALTVSEEGVPYTGFLNYMNGTIYVAWPGQEKGTWKVADVSGADQQIGRGSFFKLGLAVDQGNLDFVFPNQTTNTLEIAWGEAPQFQYKPVKLGSDGGGAWPSVSRDSKGNLHIAHYSVESQSLLYTSGQPGSLETIVLDQGGVVGLHPKIVVDANDRPHVAYYNANKGTVKYAVLDGGKWQIVDTGAFGQYPSLALDANGNPHISYYDQVSGTVGYVKR